MNDQQRQIFTLHAKLSTFRRKVALAESRVAEWLEQAENPYIAFSGGKDSLCVLNLVRKFSPQVPAIYFDGDCAYPEVLALFESIPHLLKFPTKEPFLKTLKENWHDPRLEQITMETTVYEPVKRLLKDFCFDAVAYGLRADESVGRKKHGKVKGAIFRYKISGVLACQPIWDWSYNDVWAYIVSNDLDYCKTYDKLFDAPIEKQRISYWAGESCIGLGRYAWLKRNYPELWRKLITEIPEASVYA